MGSQTTFCDVLSCSSSSFSFVVLKTSSPKTKTTLRPSSSNFALQTQPPLQVKPTNTHSLKPTYPYFLRRFSRTKTGATLDEKDQSATPLLEQEEQQQQPSREVEESVELLKKAAKSRRVAAEEILSAFSVIEKAKIDPSGFLDTLGGSKSPGRTWMLIFTAEKENKGGRYFPITAIQRFDATGECFPFNPHSCVLLDEYAKDQTPDTYLPQEWNCLQAKRSLAKRIENGVYLGPIGCLTFEGRISWKNRILAFIFECIRIKIGPWNPLQISLGQKEDREPSTKDPFFIWFYVDEEIAVARGKSGGTAFWCRCRRVTI